MRRAPVITHHDAKSTTCMFVIMSRIDIHFGIPNERIKWNVIRVRAVFEVENRLQKSIFASKSPISRLKTLNCLIQPPSHSSCAAFIDSRSRTVQAAFHTT